MKKADLKFLDPTTTQYKDMHEVFANCSRSSVIWTCKVCGEVSQVVEECPSIIKELLPSFNLEKECDLLLIVDSKSIYVHRNVLKERSQFFCSLFNEFWTSKDKREIKLNAYEYEIYLSYIWFLYTGVLKTTVDNLLDLWDLANSYREVSLKQSCEALLKKNLSIEKLALIYSRSITKKTEECIYWKEKFERIEDEVTNLRLQLEKEKQIYLGKKEEWEKMQPQKQIPHNQQHEILKTVEQENLPLICEQVPLKQKVKKNNKINSKKIVKKKQIFGNNIET
uniref:BTB domain-containing protein n=1 Tax=Clastoptera arizonana TaxID=38151 RepID=A0A1B6DJJ9_9HEMI